MNNNLLIVEQEKIDKILQLLEGIKIGLEESRDIRKLETYSSEEVEKILGIGDTTLKNLRRDGEIDFIQKTA